MKREYSELSIGGGDNELPVPVPLPLPAETQEHPHRTEATVRTGTQTPPQQATTTESEPSPPISPPTTTVSTSATTLDSQQHPKILGFHVFSSKRSFKRQRSITSTGSELESDQSTTTTATTSLMDLLLPTPILQRLYEHIPLPPIQPVTDDELVRYTMASVNAIRNGDVAKLRTILQQQQQQIQHGTLSWFDGRNRNGESLLHLACRRSTVNVVQFLIEEAQVNFFVTDLCGRTCLHDICWRPRVEEALPIFQLIRQHFMTTLHTKRMEEQQERMSVAAAAVNHDDNIVTVATEQPPVTTTTTNNNHNHKIPPLPWLSMWPLQPDIRGHVCFDYCRQEHWYEWNTYLQQQLNDMMMMMMMMSTRETITDHHHNNDPLPPPPPLLPDHYHNNHNNDPLPPPPLLPDHHHNDHIHPESGPMPEPDRAGTSSPPRGCTIG